MSVISILAMFMFLFFIWGIYNTDRTYKQRKNILPKAGDPDFWERLDKFQEVSFDKHNWYLITFRNPMKLYEDNDE